MKEVIPVITIHAAAIPHRIVVAWLARAMLEPARAMLEPARAMPPLHDTFDASRDSEYNYTNIFYLHYAYLCIDVYRDT